MVEKNLKKKYFMIYENYAKFNFSIHSFTEI